MNATNTENDKRRLYIIYGWLIALTLLEVFIVKTGIPKPAGVILMIGTTIGKSLMIILDFMHMKEERGLVWLLPIIPVGLAVIFVALLFPDLVYHLPLHF